MLLLHLPQGKKKTGHSMDVKFSDPHGFNEKIWGES
jgi:hypothetical protein